MAKILIVERHSEIEPLLRRRFARDKISIDRVDRTKAVAEKLLMGGYDLLVCDANVFRANGSKKPEWLKRLAGDFPQTPVIVVSEEDRSSMGNFSQAHHMFQRPLDEEDLCAQVASILRKEPIADEGATVRNAQVPIEFEGIVAVSLPMRAVIRQIMEAAASDIPVLITGETGTGKDLVAAAIHRRSVRKAQPYVSVNTGAVAPELIPTELFGNEKGAYTGALETRRGLFEQADGGTIFLDEISTMDERTQISLLRVLETKTFRRVGGEKSIHVDVRVVAATNENLEEAIRQRRFREDLYYRLDVFHIYMPPLRERPGAINLLTDYFVSRFDTKYGKEVRAVTPESYRRLRHYSWPGNIRELKNVIQRAVLMAQGDKIEIDLLPVRIREAAANINNHNPEDSPPPSVHVGMTLADLEKEFIARTLAHAEGNKKETAAILGISRRALYNKLRKYHLGNL